MRQKLTDLPANPPRPLDDGKTDHLTGIEIPSIKLKSTDGNHVDLKDATQAPTVLFIYPGAGSSLEPNTKPESWDAIPGRTFGGLMRSVLLVAIMIMVGVPALGDQTPTFLDIARWPDGRVQYTNQQSAIQYCKDQDAHLPSPRELAQLAMSLGAKGFVDSCDSLWRTCQQIDFFRADGTKDSFYYDRSGYRRPTGDLGTKWLWSSDADPERALGLGMDNGDFSAFYITGDSSFRCVAGR